MRSALFPLLLISSLLAGCCHVQPKPSVAAEHYSLPEVDPKLRGCFNGVVVLPPDADWDSVQVTQVIADLRKSEASKTDCGRRLLKFYDNARQEAAGTKE